jgi:hypothetical protein
LVPSPHISATRPAARIAVMTRSFSVGEVRANTAVRSMSAINARSVNSAAERKEGSRTMRMRTMRKDKDNGDEDNEDENVDNEDETK